MPQGISSRTAWVLLLVGLTCAAYGPIYGAGFLDYDDPWLVENNPLLAPGSLRTPLVAFFDLSRDTRMTLGAEYLPVRDLLAWLEVQVFGRWAPGMHGVSVGLYVAAMLLLRATLVRTFGAGLSVELASLAFALHPVHVESVAWISGQKDVLALLFVCAALYAHAGEGGGRRLSVPLLALLACLSKSMSVAVIVLLFAQDFVRRRQLDPWTYGLTMAALAVALGLHVHVGRVVGMVTSPAGGSRYTALITMGPVWLAYLELAFLPWTTSIAHDVPDRTSWDALALLGTLFALAWLGVACVGAWRGRRQPAYTFLWFFAPLLPVSQVLMPLQNRMADRYAWLTVFVPAWLFGLGVTWLRARLPAAHRELVTRSLSALVLLGLFVLTFHRSTLFGDEVLLFVDGTVKTRHNPLAPYQLGRTLDARGDYPSAVVAYREALLRAPEGPVVLARRAANGLASVHAKRGELREAEQVLRAALARFPGDPVVRANLAKVLRGQGRHGEADAVAPSERELRQARGRPEY